MHAALFLNIFVHFLLFPGRTIRPVITEGIPDVHHRENACPQRDLFALQPTWITSPIPFLVMTIRDVQRRP